MDLLASDFDDTLYVKNRFTVEKNVKAISNYRKLGNKFCLITGRNYTSIKPMIKKLNIEYDYLICQDGAKIFDNKNVCLNTIYINKNKVIKLTNYLDSKNYDYFMDNGYHKILDPGKCIKVAIRIDDYAETKKIVKEIETIGDFYAYISKKYINIIESYVNKEFGLTLLQKLIDEKFDNIYVIGDEINDLEMIKAYNGVTLIEHSKSLNKLNLEEYASLNKYIDKISK